MFFVAKYPELKGSVQVCVLKVMYTLTWLTKLKVFIPLLKGKYAHKH